MEALAYKTKNAYARYKKDEIMSLTPVQLILKLYDYVVVNSKKRDLSKVNAGLAQLISALNFEYREISLGFFRLYQYCQNQARKGNFAEVEHIIGELRSSWAKAFNLS